jgi:hypothetical protein
MVAMGTMSEKLGAQALKVGVEAMGSQPALRGTGCPAGDFSLAFQIR